MRHNAFLRLSLLLLILGLSGLAPFGVAFSQPADPGPPEEIVGELEVLYLDDFENRRAEIMHFVKDRRTGKRLRLRFQGTPPGHLRSGAVVKARGRSRDGELVLAADGDGQHNVTVLQAATTIVSGDQKTLVMVANLRDATVSCSVDSIRDLMFTDPGNQSIDDLYRENSFGLVSLSGQVVGPYTIDHYNNSCELDGWSSAADAAARANGINVDAYDRKVYVLPGGACRGAGYGSVLGNPTRAWILKCDFRDTYAHELGHNLGMAHASTPGCEYCDITDFMGTGNNKLRHNNAPHKDQMGWLQGAQVQTITQSGTYDIAPLEPQPVNTIAPQALKIFKTDTNEYYYLSYRRAIGFDSSLSPISQLDRLAVHRASGDGSGGNTYLLAQLTDGESYADSVNGFSVKQVSHNTDYVTVEVSLGGSGSTPVCTATAPKATLSPSPQNAQAGATVNYTLSVTSEDSAACAQSAFALNHVLPAGWAGWLSPTSLNLSPGETGQATLSVTSATGAVDGGYNVAVDVMGASDPAQNASAGASYVVASCVTSAPTVVISPADQSGSGGSSLSYTLSLTNEDSSNCAASSFSLSGLVPSGWTGAVSPTSLSLLPAATGQATLAATSPAGASAGSYAVGVNVSDPVETTHRASENASYTVLANADTQSPTAPSGLSGSVKRKQVNLSWNTSNDNVAVTGYEVWRDGVRLGTIGDASFADRAISSGIAYTYFVVAFDAAGNISSASNTLTVTVGGGGGKGGGKGKKP